MPTTKHPKSANNLPQSPAKNSFEDLQSLIENMLIRIQEHISLVESAKHMAQA